MMRLYENIENLIKIITHFMIRNKNYCILKFIVISLDFTCRPVGWQSLENYANYIIK